MIIPGTRTWQVKQAGWRDWAPAVAGAFGPLGVMAASNMMSPRTAPQTPPTTAQPAAPKPATPTPQPVSPWRTAMHAAGGLPFLMARNFFNPRRQQQQHQHHNPQKTNRATTQPSSRPPAEPRSRSPYEETPEQRKLRVDNLAIPHRKLYPHLYDAEGNYIGKGGLLPMSDAERMGMHKAMTRSWDMPIGNRT